MKGSKVLVTGAGGFIGSHLCEALVMAGYKVKAFIKYNSRNFWGWLEESPLRKEMEIFTGDVRDFDTVVEAVKGVDIICHLAALISIPYSYKTQVSFVDVNVKGTLHLLQAALLYDIKRFIHTSTSEVYGTARYVPIDELHPRQGQSPYAATKIGADYLALSFYRSFSLPVVIARPFNTYGPRQSARAVIPTIITQVLSGASEIKLGTLDTRRDIVFVKDTVRAFLSLITARDVVGEEINIATQQDISIGELARKIIDMEGSASQIVQDKTRIRPEKSEVQRLVGSNDKIKRLTGWSPVYDLEKGLSDTLEWFRDNLSIYKPDIYNV